MYEYDLHEYPESAASDVIAWLNAHGEAGWEAFAIEPITPGGYRVWLKRQRSNVAGGLEYRQGSISSSLRQ